MGDKPGKIIGVATTVDPSSLDDISGWAYWFCRQTPAEMLRDLHGLTEPSDDQLAVAVTEDLPDATRDAARDACRRGLADRRRYGNGLTAP